MLVNMVLYKVRKYAFVINVLHIKWRVVIDVIDPIQQIIPRASDASECDVQGLHHLSQLVFAQRLNKNIYI